MSSYEITPRTRVRRSPKRARYDRTTVHAILDEALVAHVGFLADGQPRVLPMAFVRIGERIYVHGARANRMLGALVAGGSICVTVTLLDGLVLARSAFHHSVNYRSVVALGEAREVTDPEEQQAAFAALVERVSPGRSPPPRPASAQEIATTLLVALDLLEVSAKVRQGGPIDDEADLGWPCWAGEIPLRLVASRPLPAPGVRADEELPAAPAAARYHPGS